MRLLYDRLTEYGNNDFYGFHMPGHKRNKSFLNVDLPYGIDITEIEGFDDLHHAHGILLNAQKRAARVFGAGETHFLVNGSTAGILSAILGCTKKGDKILVARHCHKSVYHAIYMNELVPRYVYPEFDGSRHMNGEVHAEDVRSALETEPDICAVVIVSPNYDGVVSDVKAIAGAVHEFGIPLIVDEAHGAHFGFHPYFPQRSNALGADVVINSLHKTLPSLTQTALLHINEGCADRENIRRYLDMLQSSSPSYILMASLDACAAWLECKGSSGFETYVTRLDALRNSLEGLCHLKVLTAQNYDRSKIVVSVDGTNLSSKELYYKLLNDYHLQMEMIAGTYVLAMTSVADTQEGFERLRDALLEIDAGLTSMPETQESLGLPLLKQVLPPFEAEEIKDREEAEVLSFEESAGRISLEYAYLYPPGSPLVVPGEEISEEAAGLLDFYRKRGFDIEGVCREGKIKVLKNG